MKVYHLMIGLIVFILILCFAQVIAKTLVVFLIGLVVVACIALLGFIAWICEVIYRAVRHK